MALNPLIRQLIVDGFCLIAIWLPSLLLTLIGKSFQSGFYCDDDSIRYPFKEGTISNIVLYIVGGGLPIAAMITVESERHWYRSRSTSTTSAMRTAYHSDHVTLGRLRIPRFVVEMVHVIAIFIFGAGCSQLATDCGKYSIGRLRPHFIDMCQPKDLETLCSSGRAVLHQYITNYTCTGTDLHGIKDSRLSFPSGHSSFSAYTMLYLALYLQSRMTWSGSYMLRPLLQTGALMLAWLTGLSRVSDYKHHWSDVLSGFLIGSIAALLTARYVSTLFKQKRSYVEECLPEIHADMGLVRSGSPNPTTNSN